MPVTSRLQLKEMQKSLESKRKDILPDFQQQYSALLEYLYLIKWESVDKMMVIELLEQMIDSTQAPSVPV